MYLIIETIGFLRLELETVGLLCLGRLHHVLSGEIANLIKAGGIHGKTK